MGRSKLFSSAVSAITVCVMVSCSFLTGCNEDQSAIEKKILVVDPTFQETLDGRNALRDQLSALQTGLARGIRQSEDQIAALKGQKVAARKEYAASVEKIKRQIYPQKRRMERELLDIQRNYTLKKQTIRDLDRDINEISALIEKEDKLSLTQEEVKSWNDRRAALVDKKEGINTDLEKMQVEIETTRMKIKVMKL
ncbi:MAG: hypothetical protein P9L88_07225 [Candidatus Tantalella remota]|nr:hypothetical protein [Candidatus Tantalella remota]